jgi:hypothetical protein
MVAGGAEGGHIDLLIRCIGDDSEVPAHTAICVLRALRRGSVQPTTRLLAHLASQLLMVLAPGRPVSETDACLSALQKIQKPATIGGTHARLADRLRLCTTLPALFALAPIKKHRDSMQRMVSLLLAERQGAARQKPLVDFSVACFVHFVSRLEVFRAEATGVTAFPKSTKIATFFCKALMRSDATRSHELAGDALRVCDCIRHWVDREDPRSDAVHRVSQVLTYAVEKRCPKANLLQGASRGGMPTELFAIRQDLQAVGPRPVLEGIPGVGRYKRHK